MDENTPAFSALWQNGYRDLLPIIPPDAELSANSAIKPTAKGKIPGRLNHEGTWGGFDWINWTCREDHLQDWADSGAGVGIRCLTVTAIDIDVLDEALADVVQRVALDVLGKSTRRVGRWPKRLLVYAVDEPPQSHQLFFQDSDEQEHLIEVLGSHKQFVIQGTHPVTRKPYEWSKPLWDVPYSKLTRITPEQVTQFYEEVQERLAMMDCSGFRTSRTGSGTADRTKIDQHKLVAPDLGTLQSVVDALPNGERYARRDQYIRMGCAIKAAAGDEDGFDVFWSWCARWQDGDNDIEDVENDWRRMHPPFEIGYHWLVNEAQAQGWQEGITSEFGDAEPADGLEQKSEEAEGPEDRMWWHRYVYVNGLKRFIDTQKGLRLDKEQFRDEYPHIETEHGDAVKTFLRVRSAGRFADRITYRPGDKSVLLTESDGTRAYNTWAPGPLHAGLWEQVTPATEDSPWHELMAHLFPDRRERDLLIKWMASLLQRPDQKPNWHPLLGGDQGIGKDSLLEPILAALGKNVSNISASELEREFNSWADMTQLVVVQEMHSFERRSIQNRLKLYQTRPPEEIRINGKNMPEFDIPNILGMVMMTNNRDAYALEQSDRRVFVLWSEAKPLSEEFFMRLHQWYSNGGLAQVAQYLYTLDLADFNTLGRAPSTEAKEEMRLATAHPVDALIAHGIECEIGPFSGDLVIASEVRNWLKGEVSGKVALTPKSVSNKLKAAGCVSLGRHRRPGLSGKETVFAVKRQATYIDLQHNDPDRLRSLVASTLVDDEDFEETERKVGQKKGA